MSAKRRTALTTVVAVWVVVAAVGDVVLALVAMPPGQASEVASSESGIIRLLSLLAWPIFTGVLAGLAVTLFVNRFAPPAGTPDARSLRGNSRIQAAWVITNIVIVLLLAVFGTIELNRDQPGAGISDSAAAAATSQAPGSPLEVQVIAQQWMFTFRYPSYGAFESAQLVLPVNTKIEFHITSLDVVHSFWFYSLGVKGDAVPLNDNVFPATTSQMGTFRIQCSELCGLWHGSMSDDKAQIVSANDFQAWAQQQQQLDAPIMHYLPPYSHVYIPNPPAYGT